MQAITSSIELEELLRKTGDLALIIAPNQCSVAPMGQRELMKKARALNLPLVSADIFQVPKLMSLFGINPQNLNLLIFKQGKLTQKYTV